VTNSGAAPRTALLASLFTSHPPKRCAAPRIPSCQTAISSGSAARSAERLRLSGPTPLFIFSFFDPAGLCPPDAHRGLRHTILSRSISRGSRVAQTSLFMSAPLGQVI
jgi:hypothetical protein